MAADAAMDVGKSLRMLTQPPIPALAAPCPKWGRRLLSLLLLSLLWICASAPTATASNRPGKTFLVDGQVALFEPDIELSERVGDKATPRAEWAATARLLYAQAALEALNQRGINVAPGDALPPRDPARDDDSLRQHVQSVATALLDHRHSHDASPVPSLEADAKALRRIANTDYGLFTWIRDSQTGNGRTAVRLAGRLLIGNLGGGSQAGVAMLVELRTGKVVWHGLLPGQTYDLRNLAGARDAAARLLKSLHGGPPATAGTP